MGVVLHVTWSHKGFNDGRERDGIDETCWIWHLWGVVSELLWALTMFARGQYLSTFKSRYVDFLARFRAKRMVRLQIVRRR